MSDDLAGLDATAQAELVRGGEASPVELVDAAIERCERIDPEINAVIHTFFDRAREQAAGELTDGPFRGVPFLVKDLGAGALAGDPMHMGMRALKEADFRLPVDTFLGLRFRDAGLITIGKTNTPELGIQPTTEPEAYGATRNPWDLARTAGGSSGGSAAAVAAGIVPFAHASDGGGSIRIPASCCGLVGLKTTRQRITQGPLIGDFAGGLAIDFAVTRTVRDAAALLDAVGGEAPGDPYFAPPPPRPYREELDADHETLRVGSLTEIPALGIEVDPAVLAPLRETLELLAALGHDVGDEAASLPDPGAGGIDPKWAFQVRYDAAQAVTLTQLGFVLGRQLGPDDVEPLTWAMAAAGRERSSEDYLAAVGFHQGLSRMIAAWFEAGNDLLVTPTLGELPPPLGTFDQGGPDPLDAFRRGEPMGMFTATFNITGQPAISLPLGVSDDGLPIGVQLVAPFGREDLLIRVARQLERAKPWADRLPGIAERAPSP
ncbi:MAG: amidase [Solirubrobacterales bacterium]